MAQDGVRKRKRTEDASISSKKKKVTIGEDAHAAQQVRSYSVLSQLQSPPVLATSPGLCLPDEVDFHAYTKSLASSSKRQKKATPSRRDLLLHSSAHKTLDYTAREDKHKWTDALKHYIGVYDPESGDLQVVEARKMVIRGVVRSQQAEEEAMGQHQSSQSAFDLRTELGQAFGTKKAKKAIQSITENAIGPRGEQTSDGSPKKLNASEKALLESIREAATSVPTSDDLQASVDRAKPVPSGHYDADEIEDVYIPEEIIGTDVLNAIPVRDWQEAVKKDEPVIVRSRFVANRIKRIGSSENATQRLRILRYLLLVMTFYLTTRNGKERGTRMLLRPDKLKAEMAPAPEHVVESIRRKFSDRGVMRKIHVDLLMTHCCVFASILDGFDVNTLDLKDDLKLDQTQINLYFHEIGARTRQAKANKQTNFMARLSLPLHFPKMMTRRR